jgi:hypothetical protein
MRAQEIRGAGALQPVQPGADTDGLARRNVPPEERKVSGVMALGLVRHGDGKALARLRHERRRQPAVRRLAHSQWQRQAAVINKGCN